MVLNFADKQVDVLRDIDYGVIACLLLILHGVILNSLSFRELQLSDQFIQFRPLIFD